MCKLFSFCVNTAGEMLFLAGEERLEAKQSGNNPDSHSLITECLKDKISIKDAEAWTGEQISSPDDAVWKFEIPMCEDDTPENWGIEKLIEKMEYDGGLPYSKFPVEYLQKIKEQLSQINWNDILVERIVPRESIAERVAEGYGGFVVQREQVERIAKEIIKAAYNYPAPERFVVDKIHHAGRHKQVFAGPDNPGTEIQIFVDPVFTEKAFVSFSIKEIKFPHPDGGGYERRERISIVIKDIFHL